MSHGLSNAATFPPKRQMTEEKIIMKAIVVTDQAAGTAGMKLVERPEPSFAFVRERRAPIDARGRPALSRSARQTKTYAACASVKSARLASCVTALSVQSTRTLQPFLVVCGPCTWPALL